MISDLLNVNGTCVVKRSNTTEEHVAIEMWDYSVQPMIRVTVVAVQQHLEHLTLPRCVLASTGAKYQHGWARPRI